MFGCKGSATVFSPESSICASCPHHGGCSEVALRTTKAKRRNAEAVFLSERFATTAVNENDRISIQLSNTSDRIKRHAMALNRRGFSFKKAMQQLHQGVNPFRQTTTTAAFVVVYDVLIAKGSARKHDMIQQVTVRLRRSNSTASGHVSDALGMGLLMRIVTVTRFTASLNIEAPE